MADKADQMTIIGPDTRIRGEMSFGAGAKILGHFEGNIDAKGEIFIGAGASCKASLDANKVIVDGVLDGDVVARERAELNSNARMTGDLTATTLVIAEGAAFVGHCRVGPDATKNAKTASGGDGVAGKVAEPKVTVPEQARAAARSR